jgi:hypothetical protein
MSRERCQAGLVIFGGFAAFALLFGSTASSAGFPVDPDTQARIEKGLAIAPVPLDLRGKDRALVGLGSYLVNAQAACNDCHTDPTYEHGHDPFQGGDGRINAAGYLRGGKAAANGIAGPDLTPDARGLPGGLTLEQFENAIVIGHDPKHPGRLLQVMPWPVYRNLIARDQMAIYEFLKTIPSSHAAP